MSQAHDSAARGRREYLDPLPRETVPRSEIDAALLVLVGCQPRLSHDGRRDGRRKAMVAALDGLASYEMIRHWRRGKRQAPQWARDLLRAKLTAPLTEWETVAAKL